MTRLPRPNGLIDTLLPAAVQRPVDRALRRLTRSADHGVLWMGIGAVGAPARGRYRRGARPGIAVGSQPAVQCVDQAALELPAAGLALGPLAAAVAYSRVHVGVHHRSDSVAGVFVGAATALVGQHFWPVKPPGAADTSVTDPVDHVELTLAARALTVYC